jgi:hypothetical protein
MATFDDRPTVATLTYLWHRAGVRPTDADIAATCLAIDDGDASAAERLMDGVPPGDVVAALNAAFGVVRAASLGAGTREEHVAATRRLDFGDNLPWLARIADRDNAGNLGARWVIVARLAETVDILDPNPWDDVAEERSLPLGDFMVRWELAGGESVRR